MTDLYFIPKKEKHFLELAKPLIFFDLETTGTNVGTDRIVSIYAVKLLPDGSQIELEHLVNPTIPIPPEATAIHHITNEMVADQPTFKDLLDELCLFFTNCDLGGYNIKRFDVPLLLNEFDRQKKYPIKCCDVKLVDAMGIFHTKEKRDLSAALKFYCRRDHVEAHTAKADVLATIDILKEQLLRYDDLQPNTSFLHDYVTGGNTVDLSGKFIRDNNGRILLNFGKHKGKEACKQLDFLKWMFDKDFTVDTIAVAKKIYYNCIWELEIKDWLATYKIRDNLEIASALYATAKFGNDIFPFTYRKEGKKVTISYLAEPPNSLDLFHADAVAILINLLNAALPNK